MTMKPAQLKQVVGRTAADTESRPFGGPDAPSVWVTATAITPGTTASPTGSSDGDWVISSNATDIAAKSTLTIVLSSKCEWFVEA